MALTTRQRWGIAAVVSLAAHGVVLAVATRRAPLPQARTAGTPAQFVPIVDGHTPPAGGGNAKVLEPQRAARAPARPAASAAAAPTPREETRGPPPSDPATAPAAPPGEAEPDGAAASGAVAVTGAPAGEGDAATGGAGSSPGTGGVGAGTGAGTAAGGGTGAGAPSDDCRVEVGRQLAGRARAEVPRAVRDRGLVGQVVLTFTVGERGVVEGPRIEASSGHPLLDEAALALLRRPLTTDCRGQYRWPMLWHAPMKR